MAKQDFYEMLLDQKNFLSRFLIHNLHILALTCIHKKSGKMSHLWPTKWFQLDDSDMAVLENIGAKWAQIGYDKLTESDYVRLETFMEPFDAIYSDTEVVILSRVGNNGVQKEFCSMFIEPPSQPTSQDVADPTDPAHGAIDEEKWVLEW